MYVVGVHDPSQEMDCLEYPGASTSAISRPKSKFPNYDRLILKFQPALSISLHAAVDLPLLMKLCAKVADKWKSIGIQLRVPHHELSSIQGNNRGDPQMVQNCLSDMFIWWLKNERDVTPKKLAQALHVADEHRLEVEVKKTFCLSLKPCFVVDYGHHLAESDLPDNVQKYCHDIRKRYVQQSVLPESDWPPTLGGQYIRLALVKQGRTTRDFTHHKVIELQKDYVRGEYDKILEHKTEIKLEEVFDPAFCDGGYEVPLKMLIDGAPGVGKTTLSRKVSQKWANGELLQGYWLVLLLHLRERTISTAEIIDNFFYHDDQVVQNATVTFVKETSGKGVLVIFDGFDELSLTQRCKQSLFLDIIKGKVLSECAVVVTSRPYASRPVQELQSVNRHIEILGFTNEQIHKCIKQRISDKAKANQLCTELKDRLDIVSICQIPLNCSIVLYVYEMEDYRLPDTLSELYELFILHGLRRYATRKNITEALHNIHKLPRPIHNHFSVLSKIAYDGLNEDKLVFEQWDLELAFSQAFSDTESEAADLPVLDLMTSAKSYSSRGPHDTYSFLHLIIQEFLCAFWAAESLSEEEKLDFIRKNFRNERFYMVLWFFAGITKLNVSNVESVFSSDLWEYDNHVHICHLLYESQSKNHSLFNFVASTCISKREIKFLKETHLCKWLTYSQIRERAERRIYTRFDCLMIANFIAHSNCQWDYLLLDLDDVRSFHKMFSSLKLCHTTIRQVTIQVHCHTLVHFHEETISLLDEIPQFDNIKLMIVLYDLPVGLVGCANLQTVKSNFQNVLLKTNVIKSIYMEIMGKNKPMVTRDLYDVLIKGITHATTPVSDIELQTVTVENFEYIFSLLIKWNSNLKLVKLSAYRTNTHYCQEEKRCHQFCNLISTFLSKNTSLKQIDLSIPFLDNHFMSCVDTIQSGLDQNYTLEDLTITCKKFVFQKKKHTSKLELVKGRKLRSQSNQVTNNSIEQDNANQPVAVSQCVEASSVQPSLEASSIQINCRLPSRNSESPCIDADVDSLQASPAKRQKIGNSSKESPCQTTQIHKQPQLNPQQPQTPIAAFSSSHLPKLALSPLCPPMYFSQCATTSSQSTAQSTYCMAGSSLAHGTYHSPSRNYQSLPQEQNDYQYQSGNNKPIWTYVPHGLGSTNTPLPMRPAPPTVMQNQSYPMPYQQQNRESFPQYCVNPSFNYCYQPTNNYPHFHAGMNPPQNMLPAISPYPFAPAQAFTMLPRFPPTAGHTMQHFTSGPEQYRPATAPPNAVQTIYNPNTQTPSTTSVHHCPPLPTTSTLT